MVVVSLWFVPGPKSNSRAELSPRTRRNLTRPCHDGDRVVQSPWWLVHPWVLVVLHPGETPDGTRNFTSRLFPCRGGEAGVGNKDSRGDSGELSRNSSNFPNVSVGLRVSSSQHHPLSKVLHRSGRVLPGLRVTGDFSGFGVTSLLFFDGPPTGGPSPVTEHGVELTTP